MRKAGLALILFFVFLWLQGCESSGGYYAPMPGAYTFPAAPQLMGGVNNPPAYFNIEGECNRNFSAGVRSEAERVNDSYRYYGSRYYHRDSWYAEESISCSK